MESNTAYGQEIFENLLDATRRHAYDRGIEVAKGDGIEFTVKRLSAPVATVAVELLRDEPSFHANFDFPSSPW